MRKTPTCFALAALLALTTTVVADENWPHWRGPRHDGTSTATGLPASWGDGENVRWRLELPGPAASTPVVWGDHVFLTSADAGGDELMLLAVDTSGEVRWRRSLGGDNYDARQGESNAASPSPSTDGERVWVFLGSGLLASYDFDGNELWRTDVEKRYGEFKTYFGMSVTPLLDGDRLYLSLIHDNAQLVVALDKNDGSEIWRHERKTDARAECLHSYASPVIYRHGDTEQLIVHGADYVTAHRLEDGAEVWRCGGLNPEDGYNPTLRFVATPLATPGLLVVPSAKNGPVLGLDPSAAQGDVTAKKKPYRWRLPSKTPDVPSPLIHDGILYLSRENGILLAYDATTGEEIYEERVHGAPHRGSPVAADGKVYLMGMDGTVSVVRAGRDFEILAKNDMEERLAASLAIAGDTIYLRTHEALYAIAEPAATEPAAEATSSSAR
jgi:outer membrane protein assembly factor BamB